LNAWRVGAAKAEELATHTLPRTGTNKGTVSSLFRFAYYFLDYTIGQWVVYFRHVLCGRIVLYDRYYFDFMADPRRSNLHLSRALTHVLYAFVHTPKLNFFLYADSATILQRKQELSAADVEQLTQRYRSLFERLANRAGRARYRTIRNEDLATTLSGIRYEFAQAA
jgi:thymidylate kinase